MIKAWADLKLLVPSKLREAYCQAQPSGNKILRYCSMRENIMAKGLPAALDLGLVDSDLFSHQRTTRIGFDDASHSDISLDFLTVLDFIF